MTFLKLTETGSDDALIQARTVPYTSVTPAKVGKATQALKLTETGTDNAAADAAYVIRSRCDKAAQVGIDVDTNQARRILSNLSISIEKAILRLSPELKVLLRPKRFTGNYSTEDVEIDDHGCRAFTREGGKNNDEEESHSDDEDDKTAQAAKPESESNSEDSEVDMANTDDGTEKVFATTMLTLAVPKQPTTDPMGVFAQQMEQMQRSFTQRLQELAGKLKPTKQAAKNKKGKSAEPQHGKRKQ